MPVGVYFKHGAYYKVIRNVWHRLGPTLEEAHANLGRLPVRLSVYKTEILAFTRVALGKTKQNAKGRRGIHFELTQDDLHRMLNECGWQCSVSGQPFTLEVISGKRPYAPSIDRIDSSKGYTADNCRIVCVAVNYAMNVWGEAILWNIFAKKRSVALDSLSRLIQTAPKSIECKEKNVIQQ